MKNSSAIKGFTLIELLVVISIISLLASVILSSVNTAQAKGRDGKRTIDLVQFRNALELYGSNHSGQYPPVNVTSSGIVAYTSKGPATSANVVGGVITCPSTGTGWTSSTDPNQAAQAQSFVDSLKPYLSQLPTDPLNDPAHCFIYASSPVNGSNSDTGVIYNSALETAPTQVTGVVVGNTANYTVMTGAPPLTYILGVTGGNPGSSAGSGGQTPPSVIVSLRSWPPTIVQQGTEVILRWSSQGAQTCEFMTDGSGLFSGSVGGAMAVSGSIYAETDENSKSGTVTMTCFTGTLQGQSSSASAQINIQ